jgi:dTDP-4-amino-4,6-dideoxygalactose transaminase
MCAQLECANTITARRLAIFDRYLEAFVPFEKAGRVGVPKSSPDVQGNGHMFYLLMQDLEDRTAFINHMQTAGIMTPFHYVPLHSSPAGLRYGRAHGNLQVTDAVSDTLVRLPVFFDLGSDIEHVIEVAVDFLRTS